MCIRDSSGVALKTKLFAVKAFPVKHNCPALGFVVQEPSSHNFDEAKAKTAGIKGRLFSELLAKKKVKVGKKTVKIEDVTFEKPGKKIVFTGDSTPCATIEKNAVGADLLVHDSCFVSKDAVMAKEKFHSTALQAAETAAKGKVKMLLLSHVSNRYEDRSVVLNEAKRVFAQSLLAKEGLEIFI